MAQVGSIDEKKTRDWKSHWIVTLTLAPPWAGVLGPPYFWKVTQTCMFWNKKFTDQGEFNQHMCRWFLKDKIKMLKSFCSNLKKIRAFLLVLNMHVCVTLPVLCNWERGLRIRTCACLLHCIFRLILFQIVINSNRAGSWIHIMCVQYSMDKLYPMTVCHTVYYLFCVSNTPTFG